MIDTRRWALVESWLSLGLRIEWMPSYLMDSVSRDEWQEDPDEKASYVYDGGGVWRVRDDDRASRLYRPRPTAPQIGTAAMTHELAHYLAASEDDRARRNFGIAPKDDGPERRALEVEQVLDAMMAACGRIAELALTGRRP